MMTCRDLLSHLSDYVDDGVTAEVRRALEAHLQHCTTCEVLVDSTRKTLTIVADRRSFELPADVSKRLLSRIRTALEDR